MSHDRQEFQVPIIFDVTAYSREEAGDSLVKILAGHQIAGNVDRWAPMQSTRPRIESWWTVEGCDKPHDGNNNKHGCVVFQDDLDYLFQLLADSEPSKANHPRHARLLAYLSPNGRVGTADFRDDDGY